jgi:pilus assembly protein CpaE
MFIKPIKSTDSKLLVQLATVNAALGHRLATVLGTTGRFHIELVVGQVAKLAASPQHAVASLLVLEIDPRSESDLAALENLLRGTPPPRATIILADGLGEAGARRLLKLQVADWLSTSCTDQEFIAACEQALNPAQPGLVKHARCTTFIPALGGAGATTLSLAAAAVLGGKSRAGLGQCCVVDLNFQTGVLADYLDLAPNLQFAEIAAAPERLDGHLLKVMLSRHSSGLAILAAPQSLGAEAIGPDLVGRLLDLAALQFEHIVIDLPRLWLPGTKSVVSGTDALYIVTELTVVGLRQACRFAEMLEQKLGVATKGTVIVNKVRWIANGGLSKGHAREVLGDRLAGFTSHCSSLVLDAQNRGLLLSQVKKRNRVEAELEPILLARSVT